MKGTHWFFGILFFEAWSVGYLLGYLLYHLGVITEIFPFWKKVLFGWVVLLCLRCLGHNEVKLGVTK